MRQPTVKDEAEYFRRVLEAGICQDSNIEAWADKMIVENNNAIPTWLLALSTDDETSKSKLLGDVPGEYDAVTVWDLVLARLGMATRLDKFSREQVVRVMFRWAVGREIPTQFITAAYKLDDGLDGIKEGWYSENQFLEDFEKFFEQFRSVEACLPPTSINS
jgi:hypothetical protein